VAILSSSPLWASTELSGFGEAAAGGARASTAAPDAWTKGILDRAASDEPFSVDETWLTSRGQPSQDMKKPNSDRFTWTILLIAFAGLTAVFARKRSGGRGLIGA
jgi:hypothetical protein